MGDFNINWEDKSVRKTLKQITDDCDLTQLINGPTRVTSSTRTQIDLIFSNQPKRIVKSFNMLTGLSDHNMILIARKLTNKRFTPFVQEQESSNIPKNMQGQFISAIQSISWDNILLGRSLEEDSQRFTQQLQRSIDAFTCRQRHRKKKNTIPWITTNILNLMKKRDMALKSAIKSKATSDRHIFTMLRNRVVKEIRIAKANFFLTIIEKAGGNTKTIWSQLRKLMGHNGNNAKTVEHVLVGGKLRDKPAEVADALNNYFIDSVENISKCFSSEYKSKLST